MKQVNMFEVLTTPVTEEAVKETGKQLDAYMAHYVSVDTHSEFIQRLKKDFSEFNSFVVEHEYDRYLPESTKRNNRMHNEKIEALSEKVYVMLGELTPFHLHLALRGMVQYGALNELLMVHFDTHHKKVLENMKTFTAEQDAYLSQRT